MSDPISAIARSVLYEGYILWPYRRSALKNQRRWTFGGVFPRTYSQSGHADDACVMRTECLVETEPAAELSVSVRFLHVVDRRVAHIEDGMLRFVDALTVRGVSHASWQEAAERAITLPPLRVGARGTASARHAIAIESGRSVETLLADDGAPAGAVVRHWDGIAGTVVVQTEPVTKHVIRVRVDIMNDSAWSGGTREQALWKTMVSTHTALRVRAGRFVSLIDPPPPLAFAAAACHNVGTWPVLVGTAPVRDTMLSSPIILYDYPEVAPESPGDLFDGGEIDQLLVLGILSMTEEEQQRMRETDPRAREILERCRSLSPEAMLRLHGVTREVHAPPAAVETSS
jgi:hypothetical protein